MNFQKQMQVIKNVRSVAPDRFPTWIKVQSDGLYIQKHKKVYQELDGKILKLDWYQISWANKKSPDQKPLRFGEEVLPGYNKMIEIKFELEDCITKISLHNQSMINFMAYKQSLKNDGYSFWEVGTSMKFGIKPYNNSNYEVVMFSRKP